MNLLTNKIHGFNIDGSAPKHDDLPGIIGAVPAQGDQLAKSNGTPAQLQALDSVLGIYKANLKALDDHAASVKQQPASAEAQGKANVANNPDNQAAGARGAGLKAGTEAQAKLP